MDSLCLKPRCGILSMGEPLSFINVCRLDTKDFSSIWTTLGGLVSSSHSVMESWISMTAGACDADISTFHMKALCVSCKRSAFWNAELFYCQCFYHRWTHTHARMHTCTQTCRHFMGCKKERSKTDSRVLPLLSIDNRCTSCLERKQQTCGVFGLQSVIAHKCHKQTGADKDNVPHMQETTRTSSDEWQSFSVEDSFW